MLAKDCKTVQDIQDALKDLFKDTLEQALEAELSHHLGYEKHDKTGNNSGNSRNGYSKETIKSKSDEQEITIPRERNGEFEPLIIKKYEKSMSDIEEQIIAMYAKGLSTRY